MKQEFKKLNGHISAKVKTNDLGFEVVPLTRTQVVIQQESYGEESVFYPAMDITIYGEAIANLRDLLNSLPEK